MIAPPIGYPIAYPKVNPIGFGSPDPVPDTRSRLSVTLHCLSSKTNPKRLVSDVPAPSRLGLDQC